MEILVIFGLWYACGLVGVINVMRSATDVTVEKLVIAVVLATMGPFWFIPMFIHAEFADKVVFKRKSR